ncbi:MAG: hypothetical protein KC457_18655 [Myxococcales bacterium]|nr:hypothetical protein [Myxococcales bacterium]
MAISRSLARAEIPHVLVGPRPRPGLRLGESLNLEGSLDLQAYFPELSHHFGAKTAVAFHLGEQVVICDLDLSHSPVSRTVYRALDYAPVEAFLHVDRSRFDLEAFELVIADPCCSYIDAAVTGVERDGEGGITWLMLGDGRSLRPRHVFDASNHVEAVAKHLGLHRRSLGGEERVLFAHLERAETEHRGCPWSTCTHLVRLERDIDGLDGVAWLIPLGARASVGLSLGAEHDELDDEALLERTLAALDARGLAVSSTYAGKRTCVGMPRVDHFMYDRAVGPNWTLAGTTFCRVWFGTSSGVSAGFAAATCAPDMLRDPQRTAPLYEQLLRTLETPHGVFDWVRHVEPATVDGEDFLRRGDALVAQSVRRLFHYARLRPGRRLRATGRVLAAGLDRADFDFAGICRLLKAPRDRQAAGIYGLGWDEDPLQARRRRSLERVLAIVAGIGPLAEIEEHMHADVVVHMDGLAFTGRGGWCKWIRYQQHHALVTDLTLEIVDLDVRGDDWRVRVRGEGRERRGGLRRRTEVELRYRWSGERIAEAWTSRRNYELFFGPGLRSPLGFAALLGRIGLWNLTHTHEAA